MSQREHGNHTDNSFRKWSNCCPRAKGMEERGWDHQNRQNLRGALGLSPRPLKRYCPAGTSGAWGSAMSLLWGVFLKMKTGTSCHYETEETLPGWHRQGQQAGRKDQIPWSPWFSLPVSPPGRTHQRTRCKIELSLADSLPPAAPGGESRRGKLRSDLINSTLPDT